MNSDSEKVHPGRIKSEMVAFLNENCFMSISPLHNPELDEEDAKKAMMFIKERLGIEIKKENMPIFPIKLNDLARLLSESQESSEASVSPQ
jgi:hypothetical protein